MTAPLRTDDLANAEPVDRRGRRLPETIAARAERDRLICEAAAMFPGASDREVARKLHSAIDLYRCTAWLRERGERPSPRHAILWAILSVIDHTPSAELIRKIVSERAFRYPRAAVDCARDLKLRRR
jgi:hypothetical protein